MRYKFVFKSFFLHKSSIPAVKLTVVWLAGLVLGGYIGTESASDFGSYFLNLCSIDVSFFGIVLALLIPFLLAICLGYLLSPDFILIAIFLKAVAFSLVCVSCVFCWGSAGWLVCRLLLFSDFLCVPILIWFWYRVLSGKIRKREVFFSLFLVLIICFADYFVVSPFLRSLF